MPFSGGRLTADGQRGNPLRLSITTNFTLRWSQVRYTEDGQPTDPRDLFVPSAQLIGVLGEQEFGTWFAGEWEDVAPFGDYAATFVLGPDSPLEMAAAGVYACWVQMTGDGEDPTFLAGTIVGGTP